MSIVMKSMKAGVITVNEFDSYAELLPVMIHVEKQNLPYYIVEDGKTIFSGNLQYVEAQQRPVMSYTLKIKKADGVSIETFHDFTELSAAAMVANDAGLPWFIVDDNTNKVVRKGNLDKLQQPTPAPKAGVAPMPEPETPDIDIDAALDEMNDAVGDFDTIGNTEERISEQPVEEAVNLDLVEDAAFLDQDADGLYHIIRVDDRILNGYMDLRYATKEKAVKHFNEFNKAHVAMITFSMLEDTDSRNQNYVTVHSFNFDKVNKDYALNAIFHVFSLRESWTHCDIDLSDELEEILDSFLKSFKPEDRYFFEGEPFEICVDGRSYYIRDEYVRNDSYYVEMSGCTEKEEWRYLYDSKAATVDPYNSLYSLCVADNM